MAVHVSHASLPYPIRHARFSFLVPGLDADGDPTDPTTPDSEVSLDNATWTDAAEEVSTPSGSNGLSLMTLTGAEMNNSAVGYACKVASGPKPTLMAFYPRNLAIVSSGTLSAGSAGGGTLGTLLGYDVTGCFIRTTGGTGGGGTGGANNQARRIITYNTGTGAFTVSPNWETTPSTDTTYDVLLPEGVTLGMLTVTAEVADTDDLGVPLITTIASLTSQQIFTLTDGSPNNDAYNNRVVVIRDQVTAEQKAIVNAADYVGASKTLTIDAAPVFTIAVGDHVTITAIPAPLANVVEGSLTELHVLRLILAAVAGKLSGAATTSVAIRDVADSKNRIAATVDADGNRTAVTLDAT